MIGECRIKDLRKAKGYTQEVLAKMCGVSRITITNLEAGYFTPTLNLAYKLSFCLDCKIENLYEMTPEDILSNCI